MRTRERRTVVTFATTTDAMAMEEAGKEYGLSGRLIPVPLQISAGCGLAWSEPAANRPKLQDLLRSRKLKHETVQDLEI